MADPSNRETKEMLLIGSSYFNYHNLRGLVQNLSDSAGVDVNFDIYAVNGLYLYDHAYNNITAAKINEKDWDYVILQGCGSVTAYPDYYTSHPVYSALVILRNKIMINCASTKMVFCMPWAFEDGMTWVAGWTDTYADMQYHIYVNTLQYSNEIGFEIAPVGWSWNTVLYEQNYPLHYLHQSDWNHPSLRGSYLMACTVFATVFQESYIGVNYNPGISDSEVTYFQTVGSNMVLDSLDLWNITPNFAIDENLKPQDFQLMQNHPNPFLHNTQITFNLHRPAPVELNVYNLKGQIVKSLYSGVASSKSVDWDGKDEQGNDLQAGVYLYKLLINGQITATKKLILLSQ
jgi:hypothetical protein